MTDDHLLEGTRFDQSLDLLEDLVKDKNELKVVALMKDIVPEYKSNYSRFEVLDKGPDR